ncbi:hypothetical protein [Nocardioides sp. CER19]|uniref:hypothetical protein n=1 Tax=Nocardioides sp. CER19 TaxID=3038538 RepID=UPI0024487638|nr:hypothetical protein [Nocardioides sp. CER19]MDH2415748.1 hypothetical protein [Nocardioides sp. CER19]
MTERRVEQRVEQVGDGLPLALRTAWWATAWLRGHVVTDLLLDAVIGDDATHVVGGLDALGLGQDAAESLLAGLARIRAEGATGFGVALPVEGDLVGLGGPPPFNAAALEAGEAVVVSGAWIGLVPVRVGAAVTWHAHRAERRQLPDIGEADRTLRRELPSAADALADLDVARWRPEVADRLMNLRHRPHVTPPPGVPSRCAELAARALQAAEIVDIALEDDGGAVSAYEISARRDALLPLDRAARHALVAAGSPEAWPDSH